MKSKKTPACEHRFIFLRQFTEEVSWHNWKKFDVFYCDKCLTQKAIEARVPEDRRW